MNKGLVLRFCKECNKKKFCSKVPVPGTNYKFTCNKGHSWTIEGITAERISLAMQSVFTPEVVKSLFEKDDVFYKHMKPR